MRIISTKHINIEDEQIAKRLNSLCVEPSDCKDLFAQTLSKIDISESDLQKRNILNASSSYNPLGKSTKYNKLKIYMPLTAVFILLVGGIFIGNVGFQNNSNLSIINSSSNKPDGTVATTASVFQTETVSEVDIENQLQNETQSSINDIYNSAKSFGDISNEISL